MWTLLADWQQTGLFHIPGLMTVHEMTGDMPCPAELWEARDAAEFEALVAAKGAKRGCWRRSASLRDCMDALMADGWPGISRFPLKALSTMDLYILTFGVPFSPYPLPLVLVFAVSTNLTSSTR
jgi:hypothetical protein